MKSGKNKEKQKYPKYTKKEKLLVALLTALSVTFMFFIFGVIDVYANNMDEFPFAFKDFAGPMLLVAAGAFVIMFAVMFIFNGGLLNIITSLIFALIAATYLDNIVVNAVSVASGDVVTDSSASYKSLFIYVIIAVVFMFASIFLQKKWKNVVIFLTVLVVGMNGASLVTDFVSKDLINDSDINCDYVLSEDSMLDVSQGENIIYFIFDRLDTRYYDLLEEEYPGFFDELTGFTYYNNATSKYTRTFPAVTNLITGVEYLAQYDANDYLNNAFEQSSFLKDLKNNGYSINIYVNRYYEYADASVMLGLVDNVEEVTSYEPHTADIIKYLTKMSFARSFSFLLARAMYTDANTGTVASLSTINCENTTFEDSDYQFINEVNDENVSFVDGDKHYMFYYLHGSHTPYILGSDGEYSDEANVLTQTYASFSALKEYLQQLKDLGVYDDATIVITADHAEALASDTVPLTEQCDEGFSSCVFIKPSGSSDETLKTSSAPICFDNIIPTIVESAGIQTDTDYGTSVFDIDEDAQISRTFYQMCYETDTRNVYLNEYTINGDCKDIENWSLTGQIKSDFAWH